MKSLQNKLKHQLVLEYVDQLIDEDYPQSFDREHFKSLTSFRSRVKSCEENLSRISSGSSRIVYKIDDEKVLKLAKNSKGLAQNETEISHSNYHDLEDILAKVFDYHQEDLWVEMELARKVKVADFQRITGFSFKDYCRAVNNRADDANKQGKNQMSLDKNIWEAMWEDEFVYDIFNYIASYALPAGDLMRLNSYGLVKRGGQEAIVLIDYGLTGDVYDSYYS